MSSINRPSLNKGVVEVTHQRLLDDIPHWYSRYSCCSCLFDLLVSPSGKYRNEVARWICISIHTIAIIPYSFNHNSQHRLLTDDDSTSTVASPLGWLIISRVSSIASLSRQSYPHTSSEVSRSVWCSMLCFSRAMGLFWLAVYFKLENA